MEGAGREGVPVRGIAGSEFAVGGDTEVSPFCCRFWPFVLSPFEVGLSKICNPLGRDERWSKDCRAEPFCAEREFGPRSYNASVLLALWIGGRVRDPRGGRRLCFSSCGELDEVRDLAAGPCDMDSCCL